MILAFVAFATLGGADVASATEHPAGWSITAKRTCAGVQTEFGHCVGLDSCNKCTPHNCQFSDWGDWAIDHGCSGLCERERKVNVESNECGMACSGNLKESKVCIRSSCSAGIKDCVFSDWSSWHLTSCDTDLDQMYRFRNIIQNATEGGNPCIGESRQTKPCSPDHEKADCVFDGWSEWTHCSKTCNIGRKTRVRRVEEEASHGGKTCKGNTYEVANCSTQACSTKFQNCVFDDWQSWVGCKSTSPYQEQRTRKVKLQGSGGGAACNGTTKEIRGCESDPLESPDQCKVSDWTPWSACDKTCGGGQKYRMRTLLTPASMNVSCVNGSIREIAPCGTGQCHLAGPGDCQLSTWSHWTECSNKCGKGIKTRMRQATSATTGKGCEAALEQVEHCVEQQCTKTDCQWGEWDRWSACTKSCGGGIKRRNRHIRVSPDNNGTLCAANPKSQVAACNVKECPKACVDGKWALWTAWSRCSATCDSGYMSRHRNVKQEPNECGKPVEGKEQEFKECPNLPECVPSKDCKLGHWALWSDCTCSCYGIKERHRAVVQFKQGLNGNACLNESLKEIRPCNPGTGGTAPKGCDSKRVVRDCQLGEWQDWSACTVTCGRGQTYRTRHVLVPPSHGGKPCEKSLQQTEPCNSQPCPNGTVCTDCKWSEWGDWGACLKGGQRWRHRGIAVEPSKNGCGKLCDYHSSKEIGTCVTKKEGQLYCAWTPWSAYSICPNGCGTATRGRHRHLEITTTKPEHGWLVTGPTGMTCSGDQSEVAACPTKGACKQGCRPQNCKFHSWSIWSEATSEGLCTRHRQIRQINNECGTPCTGVLVDTKYCKPILEVVLDCQISAWTQWSQCNHPNQQKYRIRTIRQRPQGGGKDCTGSLRETAGCAMESDPPMDCTMTTWSPWNQCSKSCGWGTHIRTRRIATPNLNGGLPCNNALEELAACNLQECANVVLKDCRLSVWEEWGHCDHMGQRFRARQVLDEAANGGKPCTDEIEQIASCQLAAKRDCKLSDWARWSDCSKTCKGGQQMRHRQVDHWPMEGGKECDPMMNLTEVKPCSADIPCAKNTSCKLSDWNPWGPCSVSCGSGQRTRRRSVTDLREGRGLGCMDKTIETLACDNNPCNKTDCVWGDWSDWGGCSRHCGGGQQKRERAILTYPTFGGAACPPSGRVETRGCNDIKCAKMNCVDAEWADWGHWQPCSKTCRGGVTWRQRLIKTPASSCGKSAQGKSQEVGSCHSDVPCTGDRDCEFSQWTAWGPCTASCNGVMKRTRKIVSEGAGDGIYCNGGLSEVKACSPALGEEYPKGCPKSGSSVDCSFTKWGTWTNCSVPCGHGQQVSERIIDHAAQNGGKGCNAPLKKTRPCSNGPCAQGNPCATDAILDCKWQDWGPWSACDKCPGQKTRHRSIAQIPIGGGKPCKMESAEEVVQCPRHCYDSYVCMWAEWGQWSSCTAKCGEGSRSRKRQLILSPEPIGQRLWEAGLSSEESLDKKLEELKHAQSRRTQEIVGAFTIGMAAFAALFMVGSRLLDRSQVSHGEELEMTKRSEGTSRQDREPLVEVEEANEPALE